MTELVHRCHARRCTSPCKPELLMCGKHWDRVPWVLKKRVLDTYVEGQCNYNPPPSAAWHAAADMAIDYVAKAEEAGLGPTGIELLQHLGRGSGVMFRVGCDQWRCVRAGESFPRNDAHSFGTVTVNRLVKLGFVARGVGANVDVAKVTNAGIAFYVAKGEDDGSD